MEVWIDRVKKYQVSTKSLDASLALTITPHRIAIQAISTTGTIYKNVVNVTVK